MRITLTLPLLLAVGCTTSPEDPTQVDDPTDLDEDGIADQLEARIMEELGPTLRLPPDEHDWTRPANVAWYLERVHLRFDHAGCPDDELLAIGKVTRAALIDQRHYTTASGTGLCKHNDGAGDLRESTKLAKEFFLQAVDDDAVHPGISPSKMDQWQTYIQVRPSAYVRKSDGVAAAYDLQVWYFFPFNDNIVSANHEADWEHLTISVSAELEPVSVYMASHADGHRYDDLSKLAFDGAHVVAYIADGSHATYATAGTHAGPVVDDHTYDGGPTWRSWENFVNVGQKDHFMPGAEWARYGGRWGEIGADDVTSGPIGPTFNSKWTTSKEY